jgi:hypothetical protein
VSYKEQIEEWRRRLPPAIFAAMLERGPLVNLRKYAPQIAAELCRTTVCRSVKIAGTSS